MVLELQPAWVVADAVVEKARRVARELKITMFCVGARSVTELQQVELHH